MSVFAAILGFAPDYLMYSDRPEKSDAIVLFVGADSNKRHEEVRLLILEGYADYQMIPAYRKVEKAKAYQDEISNLPVKSRITGIPYKIKRYFENTHIEVLEAKRLMDQNGFKTAVFVSSPYHMRRIKIMAEKIFDDPLYHISFVPARHETFHDNWLALTKRDLNFIAREYVKILWFLFYSAFLDIGVGRTFSMPQ